MTGSGCAARADIGAGAAGVLPQGGEKPRRTKRRHVAITDEAYDKATSCALETGSTRKAVVSQAVLGDSASPDVPADLSLLIERTNRPADLSLLIERTNRVTLLLLDKIEKASEGETFDLDLVRALGPLAVKFIHEIPRLSALREQSSTSEHIPFDWRDEDDEAGESAEQ